jgi:threonine/homoserine/homoserine lactone efflux protein
METAKSFLLSGVLFGLTAGITPVPLLILAMAMRHERRAALLVFAGLFFRDGLRLLIRR